MKFVIIFAALFGLAIAAPQDIINYDLDVQPENHKFSFETSDGTKHEETGHLEAVGSDHEDYEVQGSYRFTDPKLGKTIEVTYTSGIGGYQPHVKYL